MPPRENILTLFVSQNDGKCSIMIEHRGGTSDPICIVCVFYVSFDRSPDHFIFFVFGFNGELRHARIIIYF